MCACAKSELKSNAMTILELIAEVPHQIQQAISSILPLASGLVENATNLE